jgi:anti-sigma factor RsiW
VKDNERMLVSAHEDGEVETPWKEQIEARLGQKADWADEAQRHRRVKALLAADPEPDFTSAKERIRASLRGVVPRREQARLPLAWASVAAAALVLLASGAGYWFGSQASAPAQVSELQVQVPHQIELKLSGEGQLLMASTLQGSGP